MQFNTQGSKFKVMYGQSENEKKFPGHAMPARAVEIRSVALTSLIAPNAFRIRPRLWA